MDALLYHDAHFKPGDIVSWCRGEDGIGPATPIDMERMIKEYGRGPFIIDSVSPVPEYRWADTGHRQFVRIRRGKVLVTECAGTDHETPVSFSGAWFEHG
jgi:hypothetical protein